MFTFTSPVCYNMFADADSDTHSQKQLNNNIYKLISSSPEQKNAYELASPYFTAPPEHSYHVPSYKTVIEDLAADCSILRRLPRLPLSLLHHQLYLVAFKAGRVDAYCTSAESNFHIDENDLVMVNAEKGCEDIGKVIRCNVPVDEVRYLKFKQHEVEQDALVATSFTHIRKKFVLRQPKEIIRLAEPLEANQVYFKDEEERYALQCCRQKLIKQYREKEMDRSTLMNMIYCEFQSDKNQLTIYYKCSRKVNFTSLNRILFNIFNIRIWMCILPGGLDDQFRNQMQKHINIPSRRKPKSRDEFLDNYNIFKHCFWDSGSRFASSPHSPSQLVSSLNLRSHLDATIPCSYSVPAAVYASNSLNFPVPGADKTIISDLGIPYCTNRFLDGERDRERYRKMRRRHYWHIDLKSTNWNSTNGNTDISDQFQDMNIANEIDEYQIQQCQPQVEAQQVSNNQNHSDNNIYDPSHLTLFKYK